MMAASVSDLRIEIGGVVVVDGVSLAVGPGECLAIVGESGSGKTMTALTLLGLSPEGASVSATELSVGGVDVRGITEARWREIRGARVGLVSQDALVALDPLRRVGREVAEVVEVHEPSLSRADVGERMLAMLGKVALPEPVLRSRQYPHELSGGLRQRALIASALAGRPGLLIADEPTTALDVTVQAQILALLGSLKREGLSVLLISHDLTVVSALADRIAVMRDGRIVEEGETAAVLGNPQHAYTRQLLDAVPSASRKPATELGPVVLEARDLVKSYRTPDGGRRRALDSVSLRLRRGEAVGVVGESGSGKSTLARALIAMESPDAGEVLLDGAPWSALGERERRPLRSRIQLIDQDPYGAFDPRYTVRRIVTEAVALTETPRAQRRARVVELLRQVGLGEELVGRRARQLSGGQRQRVAIARALARRPEILICDEPVSALDVSVQAQVLELLETLQRDLGLSIVVISHDLAVVRQLADTIMVMKDGVVVEAGQAVTVLREPRHPFTRALMATLVTTDPSFGTGSVTGDS